MSSKKDNRPFFWEKDFDGKKRKVYADKEGLFDGLGGILGSVVKEIFKVFKK